jgi:outer membrane lipoprotein-sorting protein
MKRALCLLACLLLIGFVLADDAEPTNEKEEESARSPAALEILKQVDAAIKAVHSVRYDATLQSSGAATRFAAPAEGSAVMVGWNRGMPEKFYANVKTRKEDSEEIVELTGGGNGDMYFLIDHGTKKAYEDMDPAVLGSASRALSNFGMIEYVHDAPFDHEIDAEGLELLGEETIDGEACYKVHVEYGAGRGESTWFFSKKDLLPRRRVQQFSIPGMGDGVIETQISRLEVNVEPDESLFRMELPEGYAQIDDFAP